MSNLSTVGTGIEIGGKSPMFDKMIISDSDGAATKGRSRYFLVSGTLVGILFLTAVVFSIYAIDIGLGNEEFEMSMMIAPVPPTEPEPPRPEQPRNQPQNQQSDKPIRNDNIQRPEETPVKIPDVLSANKPASLVRPTGPFDIDPYATETIAKGSPTGTDRGSNSGIVGASSADTSEPVAAVAPKIPVPPPVMPKPPAGPVSLGVVNGKATSLPKPPYPSAAVAVNAQGEVKVQVTIDEDGKVISAKAISGHPLLKREAERAAWSARFSPTTLSKIPVKVTGMIVYNFRRS